MNKWIRLYEKSGLTAVENKLSQWGSTVFQKKALADLVDYAYQDPATIQALWTWASEDTQKDALFYYILSIDVILICCTIYILKTTNTKMTVARH